MGVCRVALLQPSFRTSLGHPEIGQEAYGTLTLQDYQYNQDLVLSMVEQAAASGAQLILAPESCIDGWSADPQAIHHSAQHIQGPFVLALKRAAKKHKTWICAGLIERGDNGRIYNAAVLVDHTGSVVLVYRKTHEKPDTLKALHYYLGNSFEYAETPWGTIGILICHDRWIPEAWHALGRRGVGMLLIPVATPTFHPHHPYYEVNRAHVRSSAYRESMSAVCCNAACHGGHSVIVASDGTIIKEAGEDEQVLIGEIRIEKSGNEFLSSPRYDLFSQMYT